MELKERLSDLAPYYLNDEYVVPAVEQLLKDLVGTGNHLDLENTADAKKVLTQVADLLRPLIETDRAKLSALLYRVDIPEHEVNALFDQEDRGNVAQDLAQCIMDRELKKVIIRKYLSEQGS